MSKHHPLSAMVLALLWAVVASACDSPVAPIPIQHDGGAIDIQPWSPVE